VTNFIDGTLVTLTPSPCPSLSFNDLDGLSIGVVSQELTRVVITFIKVQTPISKLTKEEITTMKSRNMQPWQVGYHQYLMYMMFIWLGKVNINHERKSKIKSNNLKTIRDLKMI
jgi:hypothetical protein